MQVAAFLSRLLRVRAMRAEPTIDVYDETARMTLQSCAETLMMTNYAGENGTVIESNAYKQCKALIDELPQ